MKKKTNKRKVKNIKKPVEKEVVVAEILPKEDIKKKKFKLNKLAIFNVLSILFILAFITNYSIRFFYFRNLQETGHDLPNVLSERLIASHEHFLIESNGVHHFQGHIENNYVQFMGYMWRVLRVNVDGSTTMIMQEPITSFSFGSGEDWATSHIYYWLNSDNTVADSGVFENTLDTSFLVKTSICIDTIDDVENITCDEVDNSSLIALPSLYDYYSSGGYNGFLNNSESFWTISRTSENYFWFVTEDSAVSISERHEAYSLRPVVTLVHDAVVYGGNGEISTPFIVQQRNIVSTSDLFVGEFVEFNDLIWRIVSVNNDSIKLALNSCLKDDEDECIVMSYSDSDNSFVTTGIVNLLTFLNNDFFDSLSDKSFMATGTFNTGYYSVANPNFLGIFTKTNQANVGLLSIADPFAFSIANTFLINTVENNEFSIFIVNQDNLLFQELVWSEHYVRPVITLRNNITVTSGFGRIYSPYQLGGVSND